MYKLSNTLRICENLLAKPCKQRQNIIYGAIVHNKAIFLRQRHEATSVRELMGERKIRKSKPEEEKLFSFKWLLFVFPAASFALGCWQVRRRAWKMGLIQNLKEKSECEVIDLPEDLDTLNNMEYRPVKVRGHFLHDKEILMGPRAYIDQEDTNPSGSFFRDSNKGHGWLVITPFKVEGREETILINRGWVPSSMKNVSKRQGGQIDGEIELTGIVRLNEERAPFMPKNQPSKGQWVYRDLHQMSDELSCSPVMLDAQGPRDMPPGFPLPNQSRLTLRNEHGSYIVTWFGLSAFTSWMWIRMFVQKLPLL